MGRTQTNLNYSVWAGDGTSMAEDAFEMDKAAAKELDGGLCNVRRPAGRWLWTRQEPRRLEPAWEKRLNNSCPDILFWNMYETGATTCCSPDIIIALEEIQSVFAKELSACPTCMYNVT